MPGDRLGADPRAVEAGPAATSEPITDRPHETLEGAVGAAPRAVAGAPDDAGDADGGKLITALESAIDTLGGEATARQLIDALAADPEGFPELAAVLERIAPRLRPGARSSAVALGVCLRAVKGRVFDGRTLVAAHRTRDGLAWAVGRPPTPETPDLAMKGVTR